MLRIATAIALKKYQILGALFHPHQRDPLSPEAQSTPRLMEGDEREGRATTAPNGSTAGTKS